jgi:CheY-like chemotaxis protein/nitrogen-specific signal transduction histidine kinase
MTAQAKANQDLTAEIAERQRAEEALREADRRKTQFLAMLAHELRNPLAPIRNAVEILRRSGGDGQKMKPVTEMMQRQVGQMVHLVDDLLDVSRISRGKIELRKEPIELASVVYHAVEAIRPVCASMDHELTVTLPPQPTYVNADPIRLTQVVGNLLNNACKFTEKGGHIRLIVEREETQVLVRVQDTGIGIAAEQLPRIFEMFVQGDMSLERSRDGLGLGLTLVKNLVEMHDGSVEGSSAGVGQGSEFVVRLPLLSGLRPSQSRAPSDAEPGGTVQRRILLVDDNRDSADSLAMLLKVMGHEVSTAHDGLEAVERAATFRPHVILLDIGLPRLNGYEAARRIREQQRHKDLTLVALTGFGQDEDRRRAEEAGFDAHMVKPVDFAALAKLLAASAAGQQD